MMLFTQKRPLFPAFVPALVAVATSACAQPYGRYSDRMMGPGFHSFWGMGWMAFVFWVLIIIGLVFLIR